MQSKLNRVQKYLNKKTAQVFLGLALNDEIYHRLKNTNYL